MSTITPSEATLYKYYRVYKYNNIYKKSSFIRALNNEFRYISTNSTSTQSKLANLIKWGHKTW